MEENAVNVVASRKFPLKTVLMIAVPSTFIVAGVIAFSRGFFDGITEAAAEVAADATK